ncbi:MAG: tRNA (adenosine(37)-N6)-dimethylallyltransferase MiaA [Candidatus Midichloriaceae bacterium]
MFKITPAKGKIICVYGPTASSKTKFAISLAKKIGGVVINADSMQVYSEVPILTSQPSYEEQSIISHRLYGIINPTSDFSVHQWLNLVVKEIDDIRKQNLHPILVGGTGMYLTSLINGIAKIPEITQNIKQEVEDLTREKNNAELHDMLVKYDADLAKKLSVNDRIRILRGLEVIIATGKSILKWQDLNNKFYQRDDFINIYIRFDRATLYDNINSRFLKMIELGVEQEVKEIIKKYDANKLPKIIGLCVLHDYILGNISFEEMVVTIQKNTRNYAKRQFTWFNNKLNHDHIVLNYEQN